jgi:hypothetical protein
MKKASIATRTSNMSEYAEYTPEQLERVIRSIFGTLSLTAIEELLETEREVAHANMHYGLNAQVDANVKMSEVVKHTVDGLSKYGRKELSKKIDCAVNNKEYKI